MDELVDISQIASNIAAILIPLFALWLGFGELNKWKRETLGRNRIELAQRIGKTAIGFRIAFLHITDTPIYASEYAGRPKDEEYASRNRLENEAYARQKREEAARLILTELKDHAAEAELLFDLNLNEYINAYTHAIDELRNLITLYSGTDGGVNFFLDENGETVLEEETAKAVRIFEKGDRSLQEQVIKKTIELKEYALKRLR